MLTLFTCILHVALEYGYIIKVNKDLNSNEVADKLHYH